MPNEPPDHARALQGVNALEQAEQRAFERGQQSAKLKAQVESHEKRLDAQNGNIARMATAQEHTNDRLDDLKTSVERATAVAKARADTAAELAKNAAKNAVDKRTFIFVSMGATAAIASAIIAALALGLGH